MNKNSLEKSYPQKLCTMWITLSTRGGQLFQSGGGRGGRSGKEGQKGEQKEKMREREKGKGESLENAR